MGPPYVVGVDGGTEGIRAGVFDLEGNAVACASSNYNTNFPKPGWAEQVAAHCTLLLLIASVHVGSVMLQLWWAHVSFMHVFIKGHVVGCVLCTARTNKGHPFRCQTDTGQE